MFVSFPFASFPFVVLCLSVRSLRLQNEALESRLCPLHGALAPASLQSAISVKTLNKADRWAEQLEKQRSRYAPHAALWLGETAMVSCGGAVGVTNTFASSLWFLDELARRAVQGHAGVFRQVFVGGDYALINETDLQPRPDYWGALLFALVMRGDSIEPLRTIVVDSNATQRDLLRVYAFHSRLRDVILVLNLDPRSTVGVRGLSYNASNGTVAACTAGVAHRDEFAMRGVPPMPGGSPLSARSVQLNGHALHMEEGTDMVPDILSLRHRTKPGKLDAVNEIVVSSLSYSMAVCYRAV